MANEILGLTDKTTGIGIPDADARYALTFGNTITTTSGLAITAGTGISVGQSTSGTVITNTAPHIAPTINLVAVPATASSSGTVGDVAVDSSTGYIYTCVATDSWVRAQGVTW